MGSWFEETTGKHSLQPIFSELVLPGWVVGIGFQAQVVCGWLEHIIWVCLGKITVRLLVRVTGGRDIGEVWWWIDGHIHHPYGGHGIHTAGVILCWYLYIVYQVSQHISYIVMPRTSTCAIWNDPRISTQCVQYFLGSVCLDHRSEENILLGVWKLWRFYFLYNCLTAYNRLGSTYTYKDIYHQRVVIQNIRRLSILRADGKW